MMSEKIHKRRDIAIEMLLSAGLEVTDVLRDEKTYPDLHLEVWYHGEKVGDIFENQMYLETELPSVEELGVVTSHIEISFRVNGAIDRDLRAIDRDLNKTVESLHRSAERYDELMREKRLSDVRKYFRDREAIDFAESLHEAEEAAS
jgi:hypothetical protein